MQKDKSKNSLISLLKEDIYCVFERDPAARNIFEVLLTYPGVHALIYQRIANRLWKKEWRFTARLIAYISRLLTNIDIHPGATIGRRFFIDHGAGVVIGETAEIGNDVTLYHGVTLGGTSWNKGKRHPTLKDGVMVGAGAKILGPITLGEKARIGANSVVIHDIDAERTVVGIPGKEVSIREAGEMNPYGIDLNHHLIPDPMGKAISCLVSRIEELENQLKHVSHIAHETAQIRDCDECESGVVCNTDNSVIDKDIKQAAGEY
ncbi:MAG: serine O-acetyltransferase [Gammaproteobacteria bacterium]